MIFFGRKKKVERPDLSWLGADMHSHLLPGIDDGARDLTQSIELIRGMQELGYKKLITTPHILWEMYPNTPEIIKGKLGEVRDALNNAGIDIELEAAAEYFLDDHVDDLLKNKMPLLPLSGNYVLVEFSMVSTPMDLQQTLFEMQIQNYQPVLAHPERYVYLKRNKEFFDELKSAGCLFQLNLLSLTPHYGTSVTELADYLLRKDFYDFAGTDLHGERHLAGLAKLPAAQLKRLQDSGKIKNHLL